MSLAVKTLDIHIKKARAHSVEPTFYCEGTLLKDDLVVTTRTKGTKGSKKKNKELSLPLQADQFENLDSIGCFDHKKSKENKGIWEFTGNSMFFDETVISNLLPQIQTELGLSTGMVLKGVKNLIFGPSKRQTPCPWPTNLGKHQQAHLLIIFPSEYRGGDIVLSCKEFSARHDFGGLAQTRDVKSHWISFYNGVDCQINPIESGFMMAAMYTLETSAVIIQPPLFDPNIVKIAHMLHLVPSIAVVGPVGKAQSIVFSEENKNTPAIQHFMLMRSICRAFNATNTDIRAMLSVYLTNEVNMDRRDDDLYVNTILHPDTWKPKCCFFDFERNPIVDRSLLSNRIFTGVVQHTHRKFQSERLVFAIQLDILSVPLKYSSLLHMIEGEKYDDYDRISNIKKRIINSIVTEGDARFYFLLKKFLENYSPFWKAEFLEIIKAIQPEVYEGGFTPENINQFIQLLGWEDTKTLCLSIATKSDELHLSLLQSILKCTHSDILDSYQKDLDGLKSSVALLGHGLFTDVEIQKSAHFSKTYTSYQKREAFFDVLIQEKFPREIVSNLAISFFRSVGPSSGQNTLVKDILTVLNDLLLPEQMEEVCGALLFQEEFARSSSFALFEIASNFVSPKKLVLVLQNSKSLIHLPDDLEMLTHKPSKVMSDNERHFLVGFLLNSAKNMEEVHGEIMNYRFSKYNRGEDTILSKVIKLACIIDEANVLESLCRELSVVLRKRTRCDRIWIWYEGICNWADENPGFGNQIFCFGSCILDACISLRDEHLLDSFAYDIPESFCICKYCKKFIPFLSSDRIEQTFKLPLKESDHAIAVLSLVWDKNTLEIIQKSMKKNAALSCRKIKVLPEQLKNEFNEKNIERLEPLVNKFRPVSRAKSARKIVPHTNEEEEPPSKIFKSSSNDSGRDEN